MGISKEVRRLQAKWQTGTGWPKRLEWIDISGVRGWEGQRFSLNFPVMAIVGENGVGKSTVLQAAASVFRTDGSGRKDRFASDFFPETPWDKIRDAEIAYSVREGDHRYTARVSKPTGRWRGNPKRRQRHVEYFDLSRIQPVPARVGYTRLANPNWIEASANLFEQARLERFSGIMGRTYDEARMALTNADEKRAVPVIGQMGTMYSGFHQGGGETTVAELLQRDIPQYSLVLIDEVESSLHPRAQRRLVRDLAARCREGEFQVLLTTHSPYVLEELPLEARACIIQSPAGRRDIVYGVSPDFAMTKMDDVVHAECDLYVEDAAAATMLTEILVGTRPDIVQRCRTIPYGAASVGQALGQMVAGKRFPRPSCVFLDGDKSTTPGCLVLPGEDAPERVVFEALQAKSWSKVYARTGREYANVADACNRAMTLADHHGWVQDAATQLFLAGDTLWQAMCAEWANECLDKAEAKALAQAVEDTLIETESPEPAVIPPPVAESVPVVPAARGASSAAPSPNEPERLFEQ